jgi:hypothetical protein
MQGKLQKFKAKKRVPVDSIQRVFPHFPFKKFGDFINIA